MDAVFHTDVLDYSKRRQEELLKVLDLTKSLNEGSENSPEWELVEVLRDEKISTVKGLIDGMDKELQRYIDKELMDRPLDSIKTEFL